MNRFRRHPLLWYFFLAFGLTWAGSLDVYFATSRGSSPTLSLLNFPGMLLWYYGPFTAAVIVTRTVGGPGSIRRLLRRFLDWRIGWRWYGFIILYPLAMHLVVVGLYWLLGGPAPVFFQAAGVPQGRVLLMLVGLVLWQMLQRGIGEETGWRGFALPKLQEKYSALGASLVLGVLWGLWHFHPANFYALLSVGGIFIFFNIVLTTIVYTWVYNHTGGSLLAAALFHTTLNVSEYVLPFGMTGASLSRSLIQIGVLLLVVILLVRVSGRDLGKEKLQASATD